MRWVCAGVRARRGEEELYVDTGCGIEYSVHSLHAYRLGGNQTGEQTIVGDQGGVYVCRDREEASRKLGACTLEPHCRDLTPGCTRFRTRYLGNIVPPSFSFLVH